MGETLHSLPVRKHHHNFEASKGASSRGVFRDTRRETHIKISEKENVSKDITPFVRKIQSKKKEGEQLNHTRGLEKRGGLLRQRKKEIPELVSEKKLPSQQKSAR